MDGGGGRPAGRPPLPFPPSPTRRVWRSWTHRPGASGGRGPAYPARLAAVGPPTRRVWRSWARRPGASGGRGPADPARLAVVGPPTRRVRRPWARRPGASGGRGPADPARLVAKLVRRGVVSTDADVDRLLRQRGCMLSVEGRSALGAAQRTSATRREEPERRAGTNEAARVVADEVTNTVGAHPTDQADRPGRFVVGGAGSEPERTTPLAGSGGPSMPARHDASADLAVARRDGIDQRSAWLSYGFYDASLGYVRAAGPRTGQVPDRRSTGRRVQCSSPMGRIAYAHRLLSPARGRRWIGSRRPRAP